MNALGVVLILAWIQCLLGNDSLRAGLQIPYDSSLNYGTGMMVDDKGQFTMKGMPFVSDPSKIRGQGTVASDLTLVTVVSSDRDYAKTMKIAADFSFEGYGAEAQGSFGLNKNFQYKSKQVTFFAKRKIDLGFHGYYEMPNLSPNAISILQTQGVEEFEKIYGTHFVVGSIRGASMTALINSKTSSSSSSSSISAQMRLAWSGTAVSVGGGFSLDMDTAEKNSLSFSDTQIFFSGQKMGSGISAVDMAGVKTDLLNFHNIVNVGHGLALVLRKYNTVPDYYETLALSMPDPVDNALAQLNAELQDLMYQELMQLKIMINEFKEAAPHVRASWIESGKLHEIFDSIIAVNDASNSNDQATILAQVGAADLIKNKYATDCYDISGEWYDSENNKVYKISQTGFRSSDEIRIVDPDGKESLGGCDKQDLVFPGLQKRGELRHGEFGYGIYFRDGGLWFQAGAEPLTGDWDWSKGGSVYITQTGNSHKGKPVGIPGVTAELWQGTYKQDLFNWHADGAFEFTFYPELQVIKVFDSNTVQTRHIVRRGTHVLEGHFNDKGRPINIWTYGSELEIQFCCQDLADELKGAAGAPGWVPKEDIEWDPTSNELKFWGNIASFNPEDVTFRFTDGRYWIATREMRAVLNGDYMQGNLRLNMFQEDWDITIKATLPSSGADFGWPVDEFHGTFNDPPLLDMTAAVDLTATYLPGSKSFAVSNGKLWKLITYSLDGYWTFEHNLIRIYHGYRQMTIIAPHSKIGTTKGVFTYTTIYAGYFHGGYDPDAETISWNCGEVWKRVD